MGNPVYSINDLKTPEGIERVLRQFSSALLQIPPPVKLPDARTLAAQLAPFMRDQLQAGGPNPLNLQSLLPGISAATVDTHANRLTIYPASLFQVGALFYETDRTLTYIMTLSSGTPTWTYLDGIYRTTLASKPTDIGAADAGLLLEVTDYSHVLRWTGSVWVWGPNDDGSDYYRMYESSPAGFGANAWQVCDGTTVARLNADGTTSNVTTPNTATAVYLKGSTAAAAIAGASGTTANTTATNQSNTTGINTGIDTFTQPGANALTPNLNDPGHNHLQDAHNHGPGTLELRNKQTALYYRR